LQEFRSCRSSGVAGVQELQEFRMQRKADMLLAFEATKLLHSELLTPATPELLVCYLLFRLWLE
jgi:hypothetical protein